jgi:hypothetical protein
MRPPRGKAPVGGAWPPSGRVHRLGGVAATRTGDRAGMAGVRLGGAPSRLLHRPFVEGQRPAWRVVATHHATSVCMAAQSAHSAGRSPSA